MLARRGHFFITRPELQRHGLILLSALVMGVALVLFANRGGTIFAPGAPFLIQAGALAAICLFATVLFFTLVHLTGAQPLGQLLKRLRRRRG